MKMTHLLSVALCSGAVVLAACDDKKPAEQPPAETPATPAAAPETPAATEAAPAPAAAAPAAAAPAPAAAPAAKMALGSIKSYDDAIAAYTQKDSKLVAALKKIKEGQADVNAQYYGVYNPMGTAAAKGDRDLVAFLLSQGADINGQDPNAKYPTSTTMAAAVGGGNCSEAFLKELVAAGADINMPSASEQTTPFIVAASRHDIPMMKALIAMGADPKAVTKEGRNALFFALRLNGISIGKPDYKVLADYLVDEVGLDINAADKDGRTPLLWCIPFLEVEEMQYLIKKGADPLAKTARQEGIVHCAVQTGTPAKALEQLKALEGYAIDFNNGDNAKDPTPLHKILGSSMNCSDALPLLDYLVKHGTRTDVVWGTCSYPILYVAAGNNIADSPALLQYLIDNGIGDVNEAAPGGTTPLMNVRKPCMIEVLLKAGADPKLTNKRGETAYQILSKRDAKLKEALEAAGVTE